MTERARRAAVGAPGSRPGARCPPGRAWRASRRCRRVHRLGPDHSGSEPDDNGRTRIRGSPPSRGRGGSRARWPSSPAPPAGRAGPRRSGWPPRGRTSSQWTSAPTCRRPPTQARRQTTWRRPRGWSRRDDRRAVTAIADVRDYAAFSAALAATGWPNSAARRGGGQRRDDDGRTGVGDPARELGRDDRRQPDGRLLHRPGCDPDHDRAGDRRRHRLHQLGGRPARPAADRRHVAAKHGVTGLAQEPRQRAGRSTGSG